MQNQTISITYHYEAINENKTWKEWLYDAKKIINMLGYETTHIGYTSISFSSGKVHEIEYYEKRFLTAVDNNEQIQHLTLFSLPKKYSSASFDYDVLIIRSEKFLSLVINKDDYYKINFSNILNIMKTYVSYIDGEIYEMDRYEFPLLYAAKANPNSFYTSLKILKKI